MTQRGARSVTGGISLAGEAVPRDQTLETLWAVPAQNKWRWPGLCPVVTVSLSLRAQAAPQPFQVQWEGQQPCGKQDGLSNIQLGIQAQVSHSNLAPQQGWRHLRCSDQGKSTRVMMGFEQLNTSREERSQEHLFLKGEWIWGSKSNTTLLMVKDNELKSAAGSNWGKLTWLSRSDAGTSAEWMPGTKWRGWPREDRALGAYGLRAELFHPEH